MSPGIVDLVLSASDAMPCDVPCKDPEDPPCDVGCRDSDDGPND